METESESESEDEGLLEIGNSWLGWVASKVAPGPPPSQADGGIGSGEPTSTTHAVASNDAEEVGSSSSSIAHAGAAMPAQEALESVREMAAETFSETLGGLSNLRIALEQTVRANAGAAWAALPARLSHLEPISEPETVLPLEAAGPEQQGETVQWLEVPPPTPEQEEQAPNPEVGDAIAIQPTPSIGHAGEQIKEQDCYYHETVKVQEAEQLAVHDDSNRGGDDEWTAIEKEEVVVMDTSEEEMSPSASHDCDETGAVDASTLEPGAGLAECLSLFGGTASIERVGALSAAAAMRCTRHRASLSLKERRMHDKSARNLKKQLDLETEDEPAEEETGGEERTEPGQPPMLSRLEAGARAWITEASKGNDDENSLLRVRLEGSAQIAHIVSAFMRSLVDMAEAMAENRVSDTSPAALAAQIRSSAQLTTRTIESTTAAMADALGACAPSSSPTLRRRLDDAVVEVLFKESGVACGHVQDAILRAANLCIAMGFTDKNGGHDIPPPSSL